MNPFDPMPAIKSILGMPIYEAVKESHAIAHLDDFEAPQCENSHHHTDHGYHAGPAAFLMLTPCGHNEGYLCAPYAIWARAQPVGRCGTCDTCSDMNTWAFISLGDVK